MSPRIKPSQLETMGMCKIKGRKDERRIKMLIQIQRRIISLLMEPWVPRRTRIRNLRNLSGPIV